MPKRTRSYHLWQMKELSDPKIAAGYLNACLDDPQDFLIALGKVAQANRMAKVAEGAGVQRETLYRSLSEKGNPTFDTLTKVLSMVGLRIAIVEDCERDASDLEGGGTSLSRAVSVDA